MNSTTAIPTLVNTPVVRAVTLLTMSISRYSPEFRARWS